MKILCINSTLDVGGAAKQLATLATMLKRRGHDVYFLIYHNNTYYKYILDVENVPLHIISEENYLNRIIKIRNFIRSSNFDVVISFLAPSNFLNISASFPYRGWYLIVGERSADPGIKRSLKNHFFRWMYLFADRVVSNSKTNIEMTKKMNPFISNKCSVIYNTLDLKYWYPNTNYVYRHSGKTRLVIAARYHPAKNLLGFIEGVSLLPERFKQMLYVDWYGNIEKSNISAFEYYKGLELIRLYGLDDVISLHMPAQDMLYEIQNSDIIGLFSHYEGLPNAICEGMACGKPILATTVSDLGVIINENGWLIPTPDPRDICTFLEKALVEDSIQLNSMGRRSRELAIEFFSSSKIVEQYLSLFDESFTHYK